nr:hypothetical protein CFP56_56559 [Quercus suber]
MSSGNGRSLVKISQRMRRLYLVEFSAFRLYPTSSDKNPGIRDSVADISIMKLNNRAEREICTPSKQDEICAPEFKNLSQILRMCLSVVHMIVLPIWILNSPRWRD